MKHFLILLIVVLMFSCSSTKEIKSHQKVIDSVKVSTKQIKKDSIISIPADSTRIKILIDKLTEKPLVKKSKRTSLSIRKIGNTIEATCLAEEYQKRIELLETIITLERELRITNTREYERRESSLKEFINGLLYTLAAIVVITLITLLIRILPSKNR